MHDGRAVKVVTRYSDFAPLGVRRPDVRTGRLWSAVDSLLKLHEQVGPDRLASGIRCCVGGSRPLVDVRTGRDKSLLQARLRGRIVAEGEPEIAGHARALDCGAG